jgi:hypothetical protein
LDLSNWTGLSTIFDNNAQTFCTAPRVASQEAAMIPDKGLLLEWGSSIAMTILVGRVLYQEARELLVEVLHDLARLPWSSFRVWVSVVVQMALAGLWFTASSPHPLPPSSPSVVKAIRRGRRRPRDRRGTAPKTVKPSMAPSAQSVHTGASAPPRSRHNH